jgi:putative oxidoreductase
MNGQNDFAALIGRILLALLFVPAGFSTITGFSGTVGYITSQGVPLPEVAAAIRILIELGGGLLILIGWKTRWAALAFIVYLIEITPIFHGFWSVPEAEKMAQEINFWKNMGIPRRILPAAGLRAGTIRVDRQ